MASFSPTFKGKICVIGAGVVGLSTAVKLQEVYRGSEQVTLISESFGRTTTSDIAAGVFRFDKWPDVSSSYNGYRESHVGRDIALLSWSHYKQLLSQSTAADAGIVESSGYCVNYPGVPWPKDGPAYKHIVDHCEPVESRKLCELYPALPPGSSGYLLTTVVVSPRTYMAWLTRRFISQGGIVKNGRVNTFVELFDNHDIVINCTGLGAKLLVQDMTLKPWRGQVYRVDAPYLKHFVFVATGTPRPIYVYPTPDHAVLGGTKQEGDNDSTPRAEDRQYILEACKRLVPSLQLTEETIVSERVGFRPHRLAGIRLEKERFDHKGAVKWVIHNYGHSDHGISTSWGSACIAVELVQDVLLPTSRL